MIDHLIYRWGVLPVVIRCVHWLMQRGVLQTWITVLGPAIVMLGPCVCGAILIEWRSSCECESTRWPHTNDVCSRGMIESLFTHNAMVDICNGKDVTALMLAVEYGHVYMIPMFLKHGTAVNSADRWGNTALHRATLYGNAKVLQCVMTQQFVLLTKADGVPYLLLLCARTCKLQGYFSMRMLQLIAEILSVTPPRASQVSRVT